MSGSLNWEKVNRERRVSYTPRAGAKPITQKQTDFINSLSAQKGQRVSKLPLTSRGGSELIERLLTLPNADGPTEPLPELKPEASVHRAMVNRLRDTFPALSPMSANSFVQLTEPLCGQEPFQTFLDEVCEELADLAPSTREGVSLWLLRRFLAFSASP